MPPEIELVPPEEQVARKKTEEKPPGSAEPRIASMPSEIKLISSEEQAVRKKAEEKPPKHVKPAASHIRKEPRIIVFMPERERRAGVPIIPGEPCCAKTCEILNNEIDRKTNILTTVASLGGTCESKSYRFMLYGTEALEDHRQNLKDKGVCRCIEETGAVSIMVPLIRAAEAAKNGKLTIPHSAAAMFRARPPEVIRDVHLKEKSIIPAENACCPASCKLLNKEIDTNNNILDNMELRGGPVVYKNPRYEALSYRAFHLQEYRNELKKKESCKCVE